MTRNRRRSIITATAVYGVPLAIGAIILVALLFMPHIRAFIY